VGESFTCPNSYTLDVFRTVLEEMYADII
jgi:hypothetical protein